jgi:DTW domain-containing protein YfiP
MHPNERRRGIGSGRMTSLCIENSLLIEGFDFTHESRVNRLIEDDTLHCLLLFPGTDAISLNELDTQKREQIFPTGKMPMVFVIDGTWHEAKKMVKLSTNLQQLPTISFTPRVSSRFRVRKQPRSNCYATIEAVHQVLSLLDEDRDEARRPYDNLIEVFDYMVERQLAYGRKPPRIRQGGPLVPQAVKP